MTKDFEYWKRKLIEQGLIKAPPEQMLSQDGAAPVCAVCGKHPNTVQQSILHPDPRTLCWSCAEAEVRECEKIALERRTE